MPKKNLRDYGLGSHGRPDGPPRIKGRLKGRKCPNPICKGETLFEVEVTMVDVKILTGGKGVGLYIGCAACSWASPMTIKAHGAKEVDPCSN